jgi:hypothetical protein
MVECARCGRDVEDVRWVTPDTVTKELLEAIDHGEEDLTGDGEVKVCGECMDELKGG